MPASRRLNSSSDESARELSRSNMTSCTLNDGSDDQASCASAPHKLVPPPRNTMQFIQVQPRSPVQPHPRSGHRAVATESDLWLWGGYYPRETSTNNDCMFKELWRFNYALQRWTLEKTTGEGPTHTLASHSVVLFRDNILLVFGGTGFPFGQHSSNDLFALDLRRLVWKRHKLLGSPPAQVYGASMIVRGDLLYILCGTNSIRYNSDVFEVDLRTLQSTQIGKTFSEIEDPSEIGRYRQEALLHEDKIFLFGGGGVSGISYSLRFLPVFDLTTKKWVFARTQPDPIHQFPSERKFHSVIRISDTHAVMFGGAYFDMSKNRHVVVENNLWSFNLNQFKWTRLPLEMGLGTYFHASALNESGEIWTHGGVLLTTESEEQLASSLNSQQVTDDVAPVVGVPLPVALPLPPPPQLQAPPINNNRSPREKRITTLHKMAFKPARLQDVAWRRLLDSFNDRTLLSLLEQPQYILSQLKVPMQFHSRVY